MLIQFDPELMGENALCDNYGSHRKAWISITSQNGYACACCLLYINQGPVHAVAKKQLVLSDCVNGDSSRSNSHNSSSHWYIMEQVGSSGIVEALNGNVYTNGMETLVLSHGFGVDHTVWHFIPYLARFFFKVTVYDLVFSPNAEPNSTVGR